MKPPLGGARRGIVWLVVAAAGLALLACDKPDATKSDSPSETDPPSEVKVPVDPSRKVPEPAAKTPEPAAKTPEPVAIVPEVTEPEGVEDPAPSQPERAEIDPRREFIYIDEITGEERVLPIEFKEYPEWGLFQYADQVVRHNEEQMKLYAGDPAQVAILSANVEEFTAKKAEALAAMEKRKADSGAK
jgi:hypothetical protein